MASGPITSWQIDGETMETMTDYFLGSLITADGDCSHEIKRHLLLGRKAMTNLEHILKSRDITFPKKVHLVKTLIFPVVMHGCQSWTIKKAECQRIDAFELWCWRRPWVPWTARRSVNPKGNQSWIFIERTDAEAEVPVLWAPDAKSWLIGRHWCWERLKAEDEMVGWHHRVDGHEFEQALGDGDGQGSLACCRLWGSKEWDMTERVNWIKEFHKSAGYKINMQRSIVSLYINNKQFNTEKKRNQLKVQYHLKEQYI